LDAPKTFEGNFRVRERPRDVVQMFAMQGVGTQSFEQGKSGVRDDRRECDPADIPSFVPLDIEDSSIDVKG
jgi:hypothetical protein